MKITKKKCKDIISSGIGRNVRHLRRQAGLTLGELATRIGIQPGPLGRIERGLNTPSARVVKALADAFSVSLDTLFAESPAEFGRHRDESAAKPFPVLPDQRPVSDDALLATDALVADFLALEDICGARKHASIPLRVHLQEDEEGMLALAATVRRFMDIHDGIVFDYFELFETCGFRVVVMPLPDDTDSCSYFDPLNENAFFFVNSARNPEKQLFSLAFELGLIYLRIAPRRAETDAARVPHLARKFAAFFLMPAASVLRTVGQLGIRPEAWSYELLLRIKHRFGVSAETFLYRLRELGRIDEPRYVALKTAIYEHYRKTGFAEPDSTRRILTPNGRLWDLAMVGATMPDPLAAAEARSIRHRLLKARLPDGPPTQPQVPETRKRRPKTAPARVPTDSQVLADARSRSASASASPSTSVSESGVA